jgi:hypothetical protein
MVCQLVRRFHSFCGTWSCITLFTRTHHLTLCEPSESSNHLSLRSALMLSCHLCLCLSCGLLVLCFPTEMFMHVIYPAVFWLCDRCFDHSDSNRWKVRIIPFSLFSFSSFSVCFIITQEFGENDGFSSLYGKVVVGDKWERHERSRSWNFVSTVPALAVRDWRNPRNPPSGKPRIKRRAFRVRSRSSVQASQEWLWSPEDPASTIDFVVVYVNAPGVVDRSFCRHKWTERCQRKFVAILGPLYNFLMTYLWLLNSILGSENPAVFIKIPAGNAECVRS